MSKMEEINAFCEDIQNAEGSKLVEAPKEAQPPEAKKESLLPATLEDMLSAGKDEKAEETTGSRLCYILFMQWRYFNEILGAGEKLLQKVKPIMYSSNISIDSIAICLRLQPTQN